MDREADSYEVYAQLLENNGEPAWQVLGRAWRRVLEREVGWRGAMQFSKNL